MKDHVWTWAWRGGSRKVVGNAWKALQERTSFPRTRQEAAERGLPTRDPICVLYDCLYMEVYLTRKRKWIDLRNYLAYMRSALLEFKRGEGWEHRARWKYARKAALEEMQRLFGEVQDG